jgi:hypothetical protein
LITFGVARHVPVLGVTDAGRYYFPLWRGQVTAESDFVIETGYSAALLMGIAAILLRMFVGSALAKRLTRDKLYNELFWMVPLKDLFQAGIWLGAFLGNTVEWGGKKFRLTRGGRMTKVE